MKTRAGGQPEAKALARTPEIRAVFLVGFMGAGKTSVGRALSRRLGWDFEDLDDRIQARQQEPIERLLRRDLQQFRELNEQRRPSYLKAALRIETSGKDIEMVAAEAARCLGFEEKNATPGAP